MTAQAEWPPVAVGVDVVDGQSWTVFDDGSRRQLTEVLRQASGRPQPQEAPPAAVDNALRRLVLRRVQLADLPQPEPLIVDTLDQRTVALLAGRNSSGKSFLALDWSCCIATGKPWQTRQVLDPGPVLYVAAEGAHGLHQRVSAWESAWRHQVVDLDVLPLPVNLFTGDGVGELVELTRERRYRLVVVDTWARSTVGGQENNNSDSTTAFARLDRIRREGPSVLVVAHTDAGDNKARGATALEDNADTVYRMAGDPTHITLERTKRKDGPREDQHALSLRTIDLGEDPKTGDTVTSCVLQNALRDGGHVTSKGTELLTLFADIFADTGATKADLRTACAQAPATFQRSLSSLVRTGALVNRGTDQRPFYKLGRADAQQ